MMSNSKRMSDLIVPLAMHEITLVLTMVITIGSIIALFVFLIKGVMEGNKAHFKKAFLILVVSWGFVVLVNVINALIPDAWRF